MTETMVARYDLDTRCILTEGTATDRQLILVLRWFDEVSGKVSVFGRRGPVDAVVIMPCADADGLDRAIGDFIERNLEELGIC